MLRVKEICRERKIKMKDLAQMIGTTPSTLSQQLSGSISLNRLSKIAQVLGVPIYELFEDCPEYYVKYRGKTTKLNSELLEQL
jgi:transcriptional regulator with XRE-family HTH domain